MIAPTEAMTTVDALIDDMVDIAESYACLCVRNRFLRIQDGLGSILDASSRSPERCRARCSTRMIMPLSFKLVPVDKNRDTVY